MSNEWNGSQVMSEFAKIAAKGGLITSDFGTPVVGNTDKETPVKDHRRYEPSEEYGVTKGTGEDIIGRAHPKDAKPAESMGNGGLVENIIQQQKVDIEIATRMPNGALIGRHAELINNLVALANELEGEGKSEVAARVDQAIERISGLPFANSLHKEAVFPFAALLLAPLKWLLWGGTAAGVGAGAMGWLSKITSTRESLTEDIQDVLDKAVSVGNKDSSLSVTENKLRLLLSPYVDKFRQMPVPGDEKALREFLDTLQNFSGRIIPDAQALVTMMTAVKGGFWEHIGLGAKARLEEAFKDMVQTFQDTMKAVVAAAKVGKANMPTPMAGKPELLMGSDISGVQKLLAEQGLNIPQNGKLDEATKSALQSLEQKLDGMLRRNPKIAAVLEHRGWSISGAILRMDGTVMDPETLRRLITLANSQ
jgi:hypothetical protein